MHVETTISDAIDLTRYLRKGDAVIWNQGTAEPLTLTESLVQQRSALRQCSVFLGPLYSQVLQPEHADHLSLRAYCGIGRGRHLIEAGVLDVIPCHYSQMPVLFADKSIACDVVFLHLSAEGPDGRPSLGIANDYLMAAARCARVVIAEINDQMPWTHSSHELADLRIDAVVRSSRPLLELQPGRIGETELRIARHAGAFIPDGAALQMGIGAIPDAILNTLTDRRNLGIHSGMIGDGVLNLIECGAVTNARKSIDRGLTTTGVLFGTHRLYRFAANNSTLNLRPASYTHAIATLARIDDLIAITSAIEVDLTGQVNAEVANGKYLGAVGGQVDFTRGARESNGGRSIIALPSAAKDGAVSRIVVNLSQGVTTTARSDADIVVTEWGAAELRGQTLKERMRCMIAIAHPAHREKLERDSFMQFKVASNLVGP